MGDDTPIAPLSKLPQSLYAYVRQRFAQVTNPAIDPLREELVMSLVRSEEHTSELQSQSNLVCRLLLEKKKNADGSPLTPTYGCYSPLRGHPPSRTASTL